MLLISASRTFQLREMVDLTRADFQRIHRWSREGLIPTCAATPHRGIGKNIRWPALSVALAASYRCLWPRLGYKGKALCHIRHCQNAITDQLRKVDLAGPPCWLVLCFDIKDAAPCFAGLSFSLSDPANDLPMAALDAAVVTEWINLRKALGALIESLSAEQAAA